MTKTRSQRDSAERDSAKRNSRRTVLAFSWLLIMAPVLGCADANDSPQQGTAAASAVPRSAEDKSGSLLDNAWGFVTVTTESGVTVVCEACADGSELVVDATKVAWVGTSSAAAGGWNWIADNAADATEWARDTANDTWAVTKKKTGEVSLWVQLKVSDGHAWVRTTVPAAWKVSKDAAGDVWVWIDDHKVAIAAAAAVVTIVVAALLTTPETVAVAVVKGAVTGTSKQTSEFLVDAWKNRSLSHPDIDLMLMSQDVFCSIGASALVQCGAQTLAGMHDSLPTG